MGEQLTIFESGDTRPTAKQSEILNVIDLTNNRRYYQYKDKEYELEELEKKFYVIDDRELWKGEY